MENTTPTLTLIDLKVLRNSIGVAAERGAFKAHEMSTIGTAFDRLNAWVNTADAEVEAQQAQQAEDESSTTADVVGEQGE